MGRTAIKAITDSGSFLFSDGEPLFSSGRKRLYKGSFRNRNGIEYDAVVAIFPPDHIAYYASELACLARNAILGVGPKLISPYVDLPPRYDGLALIEENVGTSLAEAVFSQAPVPFDNADSRPLSQVGSKERDVEAKKIVFDVMVQLGNMHAKGIYHRDLRLANVCVKRYGKRPEDIRATLVDFELSSEDRLSTIAYSNEPYPHLFCKLPRRGNVANAGVRHTPLEIDLGYLTALQFELKTGLPISHATIADLRAVYGDWPLFGYREDGSIFSRMIDWEIDIEPKALSLGLDRVDEKTFSDPKLLELAKREIRHGGFADAYDLLYLSSRVPETQVYESLQTLARGAFATYLDQIRANGLEVRYETIESQPIELADSTNAQVRDIPNKVHALGYSLTRIDGVSNDGRIESFSPDEVEYLSFLEHRRWCEERIRAGWRYGPEKNVEQRISDCLIPYNQLAENVKEYDREHVRGIPEYLYSIGLAIVR